MGRRSGRAFPAQCTGCLLGGRARDGPVRSPPRHRIVVLMPLKRVEPFVVRVDNTTGIVDVVPVYDGRATPQEAVTRYFLTHYLTVCERFNFATAESDYEECGAFHSPQRNQVWYALWTATNPASPLNVHKDGSTVRVQVKSVSFFTRASGLSDLAQVRYLKALRQGAGADETFSHWVATIQYAYAEPAKDPKTRRWNPLGFQDHRFQVGARSAARTADRKGATAMTHRMRHAHDRQSLLHGGFALQSALYSLQLARRDGPGARRRG